MNLEFKSAAPLLASLLLLTICLPSSLPAQEVLDAKQIIAKWSQHRESVATIQAELLEWETGRGTGATTHFGGFDGGFILIANGQIPAQAGGDVVVENIVILDEEEELLLPGLPAQPPIAPLRVRTCEALVSGDLWRFEEHGPQFNIWGQLYDTHFVDIDNGTDRIRLWSGDKQAPNASKNSSTEASKQTALFNSEYPWLLLYRPQLHPTVNGRLDTFEPEDMRKEFNGHECICLQSPLVAPERGEFYRAWFAPKLDYQLVAFEEWEGTAANKRITFEYEENSGDGPQWIPRRWKFEEYAYNADDPAHPLVRNRLEAKVLSVRFNGEIPKAQMDFELPKGTTIIMGNQPMFW